MKTFDEIYEELQSVESKELSNAWEQAKQENSKANKIAGTICVIIDILGLILLVSKGFNIGKSAFAIVSKFQMIIMLLVINIINIFVFAITKLIFSKGQNKYSGKYKSIIIPKLISNFYNNSEYFPDKPMPEYIYKEQKYGYYDIYKSEDYFESQIDNKYSMQMGEVQTIKRETSRDSNGRTSTRYITIFHGLFAKIVMHKSIKGELKIMKNGSFVLDKRLKMDSSEFEKYFDVKASNQIVGMQILTADVMEELIDFENKTKMKFDICVKDNELYIRFNSGEMFEPGNLKKGVLDKETIQKYFYMLNFTYNLSRRLINVIENTEI